MIKRHIGCAKARARTRTESALGSQPACHNYGMLSERSLEVARTDIEPAAWPARGGVIAGVWKRATVSVAALMLASCGVLPWDPEGTTERVRQTKVLRVGIVSSGDVAPEAAQRRLLSLITRETGARPRIAAGSTELLLPLLEKGTLDIVLGRFAADTPWRERVTILPAPGEENGEKSEPKAAAAVRNGENAWVAQIYKHAPVLRGDKH